MDTERTPGHTIERFAWNANEVGESLDLSTKHVLRLIHRGELPAFRVGRRLLVRPTDVRAFADRRVES